jgi:hypothetical protein
MKLSFDLDGVICGLRPADLAVAHGMYMADQLTEETLAAVYLRAPLAMYPHQLEAEGDEAVIITARVPMAHLWTKKWLARHKLGWMPLFLVGDEHLQDLHKAGKEAAASVAAAERKHRIILSEKIQVHFDNNPLIIEYLRRLGVIAIQVEH